jgi:hypothetical protein
MQTGAPFFYLSNQIRDIHITNINSIYTHTYCNKRIHSLNPSFTAVVGSEDIDSIDLEWKFVYLIIPKLSAAQLNTSINSVGPSYKVKYYIGKG